MKRENVGTADWLGYTIRQVRPPFELDDRCTWYRAMDNEPWDLIAYRFWKDENLWYIIADVNGISDPFQFPSGGQRVAIPQIR